MFIVYYLLLAGVKSLGESGLLSPFIGMWFPCLFLLVAGGVFTKHVQKEKPLLWWRS